MPLELEPLKKECETITFGKTKLKVPSKIPLGIMVEFYGLKDMDTENLKTDDFRGMVGLIKAILCLENDTEKVTAFMDGLYPEQLNKVGVFITNYIKLDSPDGKKKDS